MIALARPHEWKHGAAMTIVSLCAVRDALEQRRARSVSSVPLCARALRRAGRARREDDRAALVFGPGRGRTRSRSGERRVDLGRS